MLTSSSSATNVTAAPSLANGGSALSLPNIDSLTINTTNINTATHSPHLRFPSLPSTSLDVPTPTASSKLPQVTGTTSKPFFPGFSLPASFPDKGQRSGTLRKTIIGGRSKLDLGDSNNYALNDSRRNSNEHDGSNDHVSFHFRSSSNTSPRSLSSMSTFSRLMLLQQATKSTPSTSRSASPASQNRSTSHAGDINVEPNNMQPLDATEPWPLGPALTFPVPGLLPEQGDTTPKDTGTEFEKLKLELPKPERHYSLSTEQGKNLASPRQATSSKGENRPRSLPWDSADPLICQGYLKMVPHGMFCKFRQSKRKYCALDIRLRCFFYWKNIEQRDTGRAKCLSLVVGGSASSESIEFEMSYGGGASTAILKCESIEDAQRWLNALDLLKTERERSVSRTSSKFVPSLMDSKSINTATYSSPPSSRDWNSPEKPVVNEDTFSHTENIRSIFGAEYQKQQHVVKPAPKKPSITPPPPPGLNPALTIRGNLR